ncbi:MAG TPA: ABC transporter permease [Ilumatobacteraceae bacterium]|nr:ABC transporter permease [Ilumatobacteraceae bacterium]
MASSVSILDDAGRLGHVSRLTRVRGSGWWIWVALLAVIVLFAIAGNWIAPFEHTAQEPRAKFLRPLESSDAGFHLFGTDELGRDVFSKVIAGARLTVFIGVAATLIGASVGTALGMLAGYRGGWIDRIVMRLTEAQTAMPMFLIALLLISSLGPSVWNLIAILPTYIWPTFARLIRAETIRMRSSQFIEAAIALGCTTRTILWRHLFPNLGSRIGILAAISVGQVILAEAGLSFIGAGVQSPDVTWGLLISGGRKYLTVAWWPTVFPGVFAGITVFALNGLARRFTDVGRGV